MLTRQSLRVTAMVALLAWSATAGADDATEAKQLFREGREASAQGDHVTACAKFEQSLQLFRRASTLLNLGGCYREQGRSATALAYWEQGAALLEPGDVRMDVATQAVAELREQAPIVAVTLPTTLPAGAVITLDGNAVGRNLLDRQLRLDPGHHELRLTAPGHLPSLVTLELADGAAEQLALSLGAALPAAAMPVGPPGHPGPWIPGPPPTSPPPHTVPTWAWWVGGLGIVVGAVAIPFAVDYAKTLSTQEELCGGDVEQCQPDPAGSYDPAEDNDRKHRDAVLTTTLAATGGVALTAAVIGAIVGSQPSAAEVALTMGPDGGFARLMVRF